MQTLAYAHIFLFAMNFRVVNVYLKMMFIISFLLFMSSLIVVFSLCLSHLFSTCLHPTSLNDTSQSNRRIRLTKKEIWICRIIINEALLFIILNIINPYHLLYQTFTMYMTKSPLRQLIELSFYNTTYVFILLESALTCFI
jgi:hypothetical protein